MWDFINIHTYLHNTIQYVCRKFTCWNKVFPISVLIYHRPADKKFLICPDYWTDLLQTKSFSSRVANFSYNGQAFAKYPEENGKNIFGNGKYFPRQHVQYLRVSPPFLMHFSNHSEPNLQSHGQNNSMKKPLNLEHSARRYIQSSSGLERWTNNRHHNVCNWITWHRISICLTSPVYLCQYWPWFLPVPWDFWERPLPEISDGSKFLSGDFNVW